MKKLLITTIALATVVAITKAKNKNKPIDIMLDGKTIGRVESRV